MNIALAVPLADNWNMHSGGWWIFGVVVMMLFMGAMMWMMMRGMGGGSSRDSSAPSDRQSPMETLERRFAEGEISIEEYRARREALVDGAAEPSGSENGKRLVASRSGGGEE